LSVRSVENDMAQMVPSGMTGAVDAKSNTPSEAMRLQGSRVL
jgi:hypothetical protein